jgi:glycosyltransferase involved in cell wall biosynthesis
MEDQTQKRAPKLSVTVLNYNYGRFLPVCIEPILAQSFTDFELIVIDDRSKDDSLQVLERYKGDPRVRIVAHQANRGYVGSLIEGTEVYSRGEYVTVISADDIVRDPDAFKRQIALMDANPSAAFCFSAFDKFWSDDGSLIERQRSFATERIVPGLEFVDRYLTEMSVQVLHSGVIIRRSAYEAAGKYRRDVRYAVDFSMWPILGLNGDVAYCAEPLYGYRVHRGQMSSSFAGVKASLGEMLSAVDMVTDRARTVGREIPGLHERAVRCSLAAVALDDAFSDRRRLALIRVAAALRARPAEALRTRGLWIVAIRAMLGERGFGLARVVTGKSALPGTAA